MLRNYVVTALRNLVKNVGYTIINMIGLAVGLACFILIMLFVQDEWTFDRHHSQADDIYRVIVDIQTSGGLTQTAQSPPAWGPDLQTEYPEVTGFVRMKPPNQKWIVGRGDRIFYEKELAFVDSTMFAMFDVPLVQGNPEKALEAPFTMVISESVAARYFPGQDAMGQVVTLDSQYDFTVTGVMADMPRSGHFHFGLLPSISTLSRAPIYGDATFLRQQFPAVYTYLGLRPGTSKSVLEDKLPDFIQRHVGSQFPLQAQGIEVTAFLQPLTSIHLHSHRENEIVPNGDVGTIYIFVAIAVFLLAIASINFMNLSTARSAGRAVEVGMRKAMGAPRGHLVVQFLGEAMLMGLVAWIIALVMVALALSPFNSLTGKSISLGILVSPLFVGGTLGVTILVSLLAGSYPALFLSSFRPAQVLKGELRGGTGGGSWLRKALIVSQFSISLILIIGSGIIFQQMEYVRDRDLGMADDQIVIVQLTDPTPRANYRVYRDAVLRSPAIVSVSAASSAPAAGLLAEVMMRPSSAQQDETWLVKGYFSDFGFVETMGIDLLAGRALSPAFPVDSVGATGPPPDGQVLRTSIVLNETAVRDFGWADADDAVGKEVQFAGNNQRVFDVVGVVSDFHSQSVHERIAPTIVMFGPDQTYNYVFVRIRPENMTDALAALERNWGEILPNYAFEYSFLDEDFAALYRIDALRGTLVGFFALLTIFIACLGLFGLASYTAERRTKEIGVRKTFGASVGSIVLLLSREFTVLVVVAFVIAAPLAYVASNRWLSGFAYRVDVALWIFIVAGFVALIIAWLTVSYQSFRAAMINPQEALRYE